MLQINNLSATVGDKPILKGLSLTVGAGEIHAIMGPNGAGKSTLAYVLGGRPGYEVTGGSVAFTPSRHPALDAGSRFSSGVQGSGAPDQVRGDDSLCVGEAFTTPAGRAPSGAGHAAKTGRPPPRGDSPRG